MVLGAKRKFDEVVVIFTWVYFVHATVVLSVSQSAGKNVSHFPVSSISFMS